MWPDWTGEFFRLTASSSLRALALAVAVGGLLAAMRVPRGAVRHAAWTAVVVAMLLMPVLTQVTPPIDVRLPAHAPASDPAAGELVGYAEPTGPLPTDPWPGPKPLTSRIVPALAEVAAVFSARTQPPSLPPHTPAWPVVVFAVYAVGVLFFLFRLAMGWTMIRRLVGASRPLDRPVGLGIDLPIRESTRVATPVTVGVASPRIILPTDWPSWSDETLRGVLAHEVAHARRRDPLVALIASVNRAVFWFHPLAWWLERVVAGHAEDACDSAAIRGVATPRHYAETLVQMAETARRNGGRVAWLGVGVDGTGMLGRRIGRVLRGDVSVEVSSTRKVVVAALSVFAIVLAVACQQPEPAPAPLAPDPQLTARWAQQRARTAEFQAALKMSAGQVAELEAVLRKNPDDRETRRKLLTFYFYGDSKHATFTWDEKVAARRRHILWVIAHDPGGPLLDGWRTINPAWDPDGYEEAKGLWLEVTGRKDVALPILANAAYFFQRTDRPLAERFLLQAEAADPGGPRPHEGDESYQLPWAARLGTLYAQAISASAGQDAPPQSDRVPTDAESAFAREARRKLSETSDPVMLTSAGGSLLQGVAYPITKINAVGRELTELGVSYLNRAIQLDPGRTSARSWLARVAGMERSRQLRSVLKFVPKEKHADVYAAMPGADRMFALQLDVNTACFLAEREEYTRHDAVAARAAWAQARSIAEELLALANKLQDDPERGTAMLTAHSTLGVVALKQNDRASALRHMEAAGNVPPSDQLRYGTQIPWSRLVVQMLAWGERESVARFLERIATISEAQRDRLVADAALIRAGRMPAFYQSQTMPH